MQRKTTVTAHRRYRRKTTRVFAGILILAGFLLVGCDNPLSPPDTPDTPVTEGGLVRFVIDGADDGNARTVQPTASALAGYQFTFSDNAHEAVDVTVGNGAEVYLPDGTHTITATAYRAGGALGNSDDAAASGFVIVTLSEGAVTSNGGIVPPIILYPVSGNGVLEYAITSAAAVSGTMKLWYTDGNPCYDFGSSGVLTIDASPELSAETCNLAAGRYVLEIRLEDTNGNIALLREVTEIWTGVTTAIVFAPELYLDPSAVPAYSGAGLSPTSIIGGVAIGAPGAGSGADEANAVSYSLKVLDITNAAQDFVLEIDSLFADISWVANTGTEPGDTGYSDTPITDFSTNNVLWIKVVSEDASAIRYYRFTLTNSDLLISGDGPYTYVGDVLRIIGDGTYTIGMYSGVAIATQNRIEVASGVTASITLNGVKIDVGGVAFDMTGATVNLTLIGANELRSGSNRAGLLTPEGSTLTISAAAETHSLTAIGGGMGAGIGGDHFGSGGTITITGGTINAIGGSYAAAGIGGGGTVTISGGVVTATGSQYGAGIGGGEFGGGGTITELSGDAVIFASSIHPTLTRGDNAIQAIVFNGTVGTMYGDVTLQHDLTIPGGYALVIPAFSALTIPNDVTLTNDGAIIVCTGGIINGTVTGTQPVGSDLSISSGTSYTYAEGILSITGDGTYTIAMRSGVSGTSNSIVVAPEVTANITLNGVNIIRGGTAFDMNGATVYLTLIGSNVLRGIDRGAVGLHAPAGSTLTISAVDETHSLSAFGGQGGTGIGGGMNSSGGTITITGGTINATGGDYDHYIYNPSDRRAAAGIGGGGGVNNGGGTVTITGGIVSATGGECAAGIGGGGNYNATGGVGGTVTITGGTVTATGGSGAAGIGGGRNANPGTIELSGNAVVFASIGAALTAGDNATQVIVFNGYTGIMYGNVTLQQDLTIPASYYTLNVPAGFTLTVGSKTLTNNGTIIKYYGGVINGTVMGNQPVDSDLTITGSASYTYDVGLLTITGGGTYTIAMRSGGPSTTADRIVVASGVTANITLNGVNIDVNGAAFDMTGATVQLTLNGTNVLKSGTDRAGLEAPAGSTLTINAADETHTLTVTGGEYGAGIGGNRNGASGSVTISGGTITAAGGGSASGGAGIGGGHNGAGGTVTINGGTVTATGGDGGGAGIGSGSDGGSGGSVTISNSTVTAIGGDGGAGIGGGKNGAGGTITINNGTVTATGSGSDYGGAGIGGGYSGAGGSVTIDGGTVTATGSSYSAGIGGGGGGGGGSVTISGGTVTATGGDYRSGGDLGGGAGIGSGNGGADGTVVISGGAVIANGGYYSAGIGGGANGAGGSITISGGTITATGGSNGAGIGGGRNGASGTIMISGDTVTATGGSSGAGIGGGYYGTGGNVTINGGVVTATGGTNGAGIGGGYHGGGATVKIIGGLVTATGSGSSSYHGAGIGGGSLSGYSQGTIAELSGNAVIFASSIEPTLTAGSNATQAIAFNGNTGTMYGNVTLQQDLTIPGGYTLNLSSGNTLTIPGNVTLTNEGTINQNGGTIDGTVGGGGTVN